MHCRTLNPAAREKSPSTDRVQDQPHVFGDNPHADREGEEEGKDDTGHDVIKWLGRTGGRRLDRGDCGLQAGNGACSRSNDDCETPPEEPELGAEALTAVTTHVEPPRPAPEEK